MTSSFLTNYSYTDEVVNVSNGRNNSGTHVRTFVYTHI